MAPTQPDRPLPGPAVAATGSTSRAFIRKIGTTAWVVLLDVTLDTRQEEAGWTARTNIRLIADHLGVTPGTVARALARLTAAGLVQRQDRRDRVTGRFVESVYVVAPAAGVVPCVDCPHTAELHPVSWHGPATNRRDHEAGQRLPEGMASVCCTFSDGDPLHSGVDAVLGARRDGGNRRGREGDGLGLAGRGWLSC